MEDGRRLMGYDPETAEHVCDRARRDLGMNAVRGGSWRDHSWIGTIGFPSESEVLRFLRLELAAKDVIKSEKIGADGITELKRTVVRAFKNPEIYDEFLESLRERQKAASR